MDRRSGAPLAAALAASGALGLLADSASLGLWIGLALWAPAAGWIAGVRLAPAWYAAPPIAWAALLLVVGRAEPAPLDGALAVAALYAVGLLLGAALRPRVDGPGDVAAGAAALLLVAGLLTAAPSLGGAAVRPPSPARTARLLDLSPVVWACESAGLDWMRHVSVYEVAGAGDLGPERRAPYAGGGTPGLVLGVAAALALLFARRRAPRAPAG